jgi:hypothetical protein
MAESGSAARTSIHTTLNAASTLTHTSRHHINNQSTPPPPQTKPNNQTKTKPKILAGKLKPNLGRFESAPDWEEILAYFRGSELQNYFTKVCGGGGGVVWGG